MIELEALDDEHEGRNDFRRANGAPLVSDPKNPDKTLRYRRPSGYGKVLDDENALVEWRIWKAMQGVARSGALCAKVSVCKDDDKAEKKALREEALDKGAANEAADTGTALHAMTVRVEDPDDYFEIPEQYKASLTAYTKALEEFDLSSELTEVHMVNDAYRAAGTADRLYRTHRNLEMPDGSILPAGSLILADIKTGKKLDFSLPGYCVQMAIYADGVLYDIHTESRLPTPEINREWSLLVHLPVDRPVCEMQWLSVPLGLHGAWISHEVKEWQKNWKNGTHDAYPAKPPEHDVVADATTCEVELPYEDILSATITVVTNRIAIIGSHVDARKMLMQRWPAGVATPKSGLLRDPGDIRKILDLLDAVEAKYSIPFGDASPMIGLQAGKNRKDIDRSNGGLVGKIQEYLEQ